ncbi:MAG: stage VI sporulation protein F [Candidatus Carbobacillus sp.]|nr:stage VI sporulation protein F [Candidatus Carbobacillus sp.]
MNLGQLFELIQQSAKKPVDQKALLDTAKDIHVGDQNNEEKMRALVRRLSQVLGMNLSPEREESIMAYLRENRFTGIESIQKLLKEKQLSPAKDASNGEHPTQATSTHKKVKKTQTKKD